MEFSLDGVYLSQVSGGGFFFYHSAREMEMELEMEIEGGRLRLALIQ